YPARREQNAATAVRIPSSPPMDSAMPVLRILTLLLPLCLLGACSSFESRDPLRVELAGLKPLPAEGLEARFELSMRVQNPNAQAVDFDGLAVDLDLNGQPLISGVSNQRGVVPRFGETLVRLPVSLSALS